MEIIRYSAHSFRSMDDLGFDPLEYSKMKYGSKEISRKYGKELGTRFVNDLTMNTYFFPKVKDIVVASSPYRFIPTASKALTDYFIAAFNMVWAVNHNPAQLFKINRSHSYLDDYGQMSASERLNLISSDDFYIDKEYIKGKTLILIDDISVTQSHEKTMLKLVEEAEFDGIVFCLYYANLIGDKCPTIENDLNYAFVKDLDDINSIIRENEFIFNTRVCKYMLKYNSEEFKHFIKYQSDSFRETLLTCSQGNGYHLEESFRENYQTLLKYL